MKRLMLIIPFLLRGSLLMLTNSKNPKLSSYDNTTPKADIQTYFNGPIKAWGIIQDWRGRVVSRFDVDMVGSWEGGVGTLKENFRYYNGDTQKRVWTITKNADGNYTGKADDIIGDASGFSNGSALQWNYKMDITVDGRTYRINFDDWMWQMNDGVLINRSYLKKYGFTVAELTLFMKK
jgi:hypothetical protein